MQNSGCHKMEYYTFAFVGFLVLAAAGLTEGAETLVFNSTNISSPAPSSSLLSTPKSLSILSSISTISNALDTFPIDWNTVSKLPSLNAIEVTVAGTCACDLTLNGCDGNCCCDAECDQDAKALFLGCAPEGPPPPSLDYCVPRSQVATVNLHHSSSLAVVETSMPGSGFLSKQLCIARENNAELGQFFADPEPAVETDLAAAASQLGEFAFGKSGNAVTTRRESTYRVGDSVPAAYLIDGGSGLVPIGAGSSFAVPAPTLSAACEGLQTVGFLVDVPVTTCQRISQALSQDCATVFGSDRLVSWLRIGQTGAAVQSQPSGYVGVTLGTVRFADPNSGKLSSSATAPPAAYDANSGTCQNSLRKVAYAVAHNGLGSITSVTADLVLTNTTFDALTGLASLEQTFSIEWVKDGTQNKVRPKSGNPGYLTGYPVLAGQITASSDGSKQAIAQYTDGLPIPSAGPDGICDPNHVSNVRFGTDALTSCRVPLTQAQLAAFCQSTPASPLPVQQLGGLFGALSNDAYIATWASADASNVFDWQKVTVEGMTGAMTWDASLLTCHGVATGLTYQFLVSKVGSRDNPQRQISYSRVTLSYSDWAFQDATQPDAPQNFVIQNTVKFLPRIQEEARTIGRPPPPLLPSLPDDLFYPFFISSAWSTQHMSWSRSLWMPVLVGLGCVLTGFKV